MKKTKHNYSLHLLITLAFLFSSHSASETLMNPTSSSKDLYPEEILDGNYLDSIANPREFLGFEKKFRRPTKNLPPRIAKKKLKIL